MTWAGTVTRLLDSATELPLGETDFTVLQTAGDDEVLTISRATPPFQDVTAWQAPSSPVAVQVPDKCREAMFERCRNDLPCETGGILAGTDREDGPALVINAQDPPPDSIQESTMFLRGTDKVENWLRDARESLGINYLGEWHYHPAAPPEISPDDRKAMNEIAADDGYDCPHPLLFLVGQDDTQEFAVNAYLFHRDNDYEQLHRIGNQPDDTGNKGTDGETE